MTHLADSSHGQRESLDRRRLLRWLGGTAALILPATLAACANSTSPRRYRRPSSHITGMDHRDGAVGLKHVTNF
jgi:hypothetical protein